MRWVLIGHRGTGKTSLLSRLGKYIDQQSLNVPVFDLDFEIQKTVGQDLTHYFSSVGEVEFRKKEIEVFQNIIKSHTSYIVSLGAGFQLQTIPLGVKKIWIRRYSDSIGRIFLDRPRLDSQQPPLVEYQARYPVREDHYKHYADMVYTMPEGQIDQAENFADWEEMYFFGSASMPRGILTLLPHHLREPRPCSFAQALELRDDLLRDDEIKKAQEIFSHKNLIYSLRKSKDLPAVADNMELDWALELGEPPQDFKGIVSAHDRPHGVDFKSWLSQLSTHEAAGRHLKLAPALASFSDLQELCKWQQQNPSNRSIFPRSIDGSWSWFRHCWWGRQKMNFWQDGNGSALDQPTWWELFAKPRMQHGFAAVLGSPVSHSYSPLFHTAFFRQFNMPFYAVKVAQVEADLAFKFLTELGLKAAAVTSPLKSWAAQVATDKQPLVAHLSVANTLVVNEKQVSAELTDLAGFEQMLLSVFANSELDIKSAKVKVWGGGGTLPVVKRLAPQADFYSVRTGQIRDGDIPEASVSYEALIWAASPDADLPEINDSCRFILDLNYREDSKAKELAQKFKIPYYSGIKMFVEQALEQQKFWKQKLVSAEK